MLLHIWLVLLIGNSPAGSAKPGEGVFGSISVRLGGALQGTEASSEAPPDLGPPGEAPQRRHGGRVRPLDTPPTPDQPGAAQLGQWAPQETQVRTLGSEGRVSPLPALPDDIAPLPDRTVREFGKLAEPSSEIQRNQHAALSPLPSVERLEPLPAARLPLQAEPSPVQRSRSASIEKLSSNAAPTPSPLPPLALPLRAEPSVPLQRVQAARVDKAPALPSDLALQAVPSPSLPMTQLQTASSSLSRLPRAAPLAPIAASAPQDLAPLPRPALPMAQLQTSGDSAPQRSRAQPLQAAPPLAAPELQALPPPRLPLSPPQSSARMQAPAVDKLSLEQALQNSLDKVPSLSSVPASSGPPPAQTGSRPSLDTAASGRPDPQAAPVGQAGDKVDLMGRPVQQPGSPDAGGQQGHDVATPPSAPASRPRLNLELPRAQRGGPLSSQPSNGVFELMARPPETKSKLQKELEEAARKDCREAYAEKGLLAGPLLALDAARGKGCRW